MVNPSVGVVIFGELGFNLFELKEWLMKKEKEILIVWWVLG